ncbi:MAG: hypothetical protein ACKV2V_02435, partial [Blastocatellia bacterium]
LDDLAAVNAFYATHPNRDVYDFVSLFIDFNYSLPGNAFAYYQGWRNDINGIGSNTFNSDPAGTDTGNLRMQGYMNLNNISTQYPEYPTDRFFGADSALSIFGQEQGHRWMSYIRYPGTDSTLLLGRGNGHWNYFMNIESTISGPAARRSSSMEGSVLRDNGDGTHTTVNLVDGFSRLDQYLMGFRPASDVPDTFVLTNLTTTGGRTKSSSPRPNIQVAGTKQTVTVADIITRNGARTPDVNASQKNLRVAFVLVTAQGATASTATITRLTRYRLAWESYFAQAIDYKGTLNCGLADLPAGSSRAIATVSAASYANAMAPGGIATIFGSGLTSGGSASAVTQPLPTTLGGTEVRVNGTPAALYFVSPTQINFQVPRTARARETAFVPAVESSTATVEVFVNGTLVRAGTALLGPSVPGVFTTNASGAGPAAAIDGINFTAAPFNARQTNGQPNAIAVFASGLGADGTDVDANLAGSVTATIGGQNAPVGYAGRAPGFTGLNQINLTLPAGITAGTHNLIISRNGIPGVTTTVAIR